MRSGTIISVFGAKARIGKTVLATNLAAALAQETGRRVALADLHLRFGDVAIYLNLPAERSIADLTPPIEQLDEKLLESCLYTHSTGVRVLPAPANGSESTNISVDHIETILRLLRDTHDYVVLDTGMPINDTIAMAIILADVRLLVTKGDFDVLTATQELLAVLSEQNLDVKLAKVVTSGLSGESLAGGALQACGDLWEDDKFMESILGRFVDYSVPYDSNIRKSVEQGMPVVVTNPDSETSQTIFQLCRELVQHSHGVMESATFGSRGTFASTQGQEEGPNDTRTVARRRNMKAMRSMETPNHTSSQGARELSPAQHHRREEKETMRRARKDGQEGKASGMPKRRANTTLGAWLKLCPAPDGMKAIFPCEDSIVCEDLLSGDAIKDVPTVKQLLDSERGVVIPCRDPMHAVETLMFVQKNYILEVLPSLRGVLRRIRRNLKIASAEDSTWQQIWAQVRT